MSDQHAAGNLGEGAAERCRPEDSPSPRRIAIYSRSDASRTLSANESVANRYAADPRRPWAGVPSMIVRLAIAVLLVIGAAIAAYLLPGQIRHLIIPITIFALLGVWIWRKKRRRHIAVRIDA